MMNQLSKLFPFQLTQESLDGLALKGWIEIRAGKV